MCLFAVKGKMTAEKPVRTYKMVCVRKDPREGAFRWTGAFVQKDSFPFRREVFAAGEKEVFDFGERIRVGKGHFHSIQGLPGCVDYMRRSLHDFCESYGGSCRIVRCEIPAGTVYYTDGCGFFASESIIVGEPSRLTDAVVLSALAARKFHEFICRVCRRVHYIIFVH